MRMPNRCRVSIEELLDLAEGRVDKSAADRLQAHLAAGCETCETRRAEIGRVLGVMRQGELTSAPEYVRQQAGDLFRELYVKPQRQSLFAQLVFDSRSRFAAAGARGVDAGQAQALYSTDEHDIDLWQEQAADGLWYVIGQVLPKDGGTALVPDGALLIGVAGNPMPTRQHGAEFHLNSVPAGTYLLRITLPNVEITVAEVVIGN